MSAETVSFMGLEPHLREDDYRQAFLASCGVETFRTKSG